MLVWLDMFISPQIGYAGEVWEEDFSQKLRIRAPSAHGKCATWIKIISPTWPTKGVEEPQMVHHDPQMAQQ